MDSSLREIRPDYSEETFASTTSKICLKHSLEGLGFNVCGGRDSPHLPGRTEPFVAYVTPMGEAFRGGLRAGDRISRINGINVENLKHDEIVNLLRQVPDVTLEVEPGGEARILTETQLERTERLPDASPSWLVERTASYVAALPEMKEFQVENKVDKKKSIGTSHILLFGVGIIIGVAATFGFQLRRGIIY